MTGTHVSEWLSAYMDHELAPARRERVAAHLERCAACRNELAALEHDAREFEAMYAERRQAGDRVVQGGLRRWEEASHQASWSWTTHLRHALQAVRWSWVMTASVPVAAAAMVGVLVMQHGMDQAQMASVPFRAAPWPQKARPTPVLPPPSPRVVGVMTAMTANPQVMDPAMNRWRPLAQGEVLPQVARVKTGRAKMEVQLVDGSVLRLDQQTEVVLESSRHLALREGRVWVHAAKAKEAERPVPFQVVGHMGTVTALGTEFDLIGSKERFHLLMLGGAAMLENAAGERRKVMAGEEASVHQGVLLAPTSVQLAGKASQWMFDLLVQKGEDNPELYNRVSDLLVELGQSKVSLMDEREIIALGEVCRLPVTKFLVSPAHRSDTQRRRKAARILQTLADESVLPQLVALLEEGDDLQVMASLVHAAERIAGRTFRPSGSTWMQLSEGSRRQVVERISEWFRTR